MTAGSTGSSIPKWQLALLVGAPIAIGLSYLYLKNRHEDPEKKRLAEVAAKKTISLDETDKEKGKEKTKPIQITTALKAAGNAAFQEGKYDEAIAFYNEAIASCPPNFPTDLATYYQNRSACHEKREMWQKVIDDCTKALGYNEKYVKAFLRRSRAAERSGDLVMALEDVTAACILEGFQVHGSLIMADRILRALGKKHARDAMATKKAVMPSKHFIKTYISSFAQDPIIKPVKSLSGEGGDDSNGETSSYSKAKEALKKGEYDSIIQLCTDEIKNTQSADKNKMEATLLRGTFYLLLGEHNEALKDLSLVISREDLPIKTRVNALIKRASMYMQTEDIDKCQEDYEKANELDPDNCDVHHHRGQAHLLTSKLPEATDEFSKAVELNPNFPVALIQKCYAQYTVMKFINRVNDLTSVFQSFEEAIAKFPNCPEAYILYAEVLSEQNDLSRADALLDKAIELDPAHANVLVHRAMMVLKKDGNIDVAVQLINKAIEIDDKCLFAYETLGAIEVQRQNLKQAIELFEKAIMVARTEQEMTHLFSLKDAAVAQMKASERWGLKLSSLTPT